MKKVLTHLQSWYGSYCVLLLVLIVIIMWGNRNKGRYQIATSGFREACWIIDTRTSQVWFRTFPVVVDLGTNTNLNRKIHVLETDDKITTTESKVNEEQIEPPEGFVLENKEPNGFKKWQQQNKWWENDPIVE